MCSPNCVSPTLRSLCFSVFRLSFCLSVSVFLMVSSPLRGLHLDICFPFGNPVHSVRELCSHPGPFGPRFPPPMIWHVADYHPNCCLGTAGEPVPRPTTITNPLRYRCESPGHFNVTSLDGPYPSVLRTLTTLAHYDPLIDRDLSK